MNGVREVSPGRFVATMYSPFVRGTTKHVGVFASRDAAAEAKREAERERDIEIAALKDETCGSFARRWPRDYTRRRGVSTLEHHAERSRAFIRDFEDRPLRGVQPIEARAWIEGGVVPPQLRRIAARWENARNLGADIEVPAHRSWLSPMRAMFNDALADDLVARNPFASLRIEQSQGRAGEATTVLTDSELASLVERCEALGAYGPHFAAVIETLAWTGLRPGEAYALDIAHVDLAAGVLSVEAQIDKRGRRRPPKWNSQRAPALLPEAADALRRAIGEREIGPVFLGSGGRRLTRSVLAYHWKKVRPGEMAVYELRHRYGTYLGCELEMAPPLIAKLMGHKDGGGLALKRYVHASDDWTQASLLERHAALQRRRVIAAAG